MSIEDTSTRKDPRRFTKTVVRLEVLSEEEFAIESPEDLSRMIGSHNAFCSLNVERTQHLAPRQVATELEHHGENPSRLLGPDWSPPPPVDRAIIGTFLKQAWEQPGDRLVTLGSMTFNATDFVLSMPLEWLHELEDHQYSTDELGAEFIEHDGPFEVEIVDSICAFFGVDDLSDVDQTMLEKQRQLFGL